MLRVFLEGQDSLGRSNVTCWAHKIELKRVKSGRMDLGSLSC